MDPSAGSTLATPAIAARTLANDACAEARVEMDDAHDPAAAQRAAEVLSSVWGRKGTEMIDPAMLVAIAHAGNLVTVATEDGKPVGAAAGFCGPPGTHFHSHIVGLVETATGRGLGRAMKLYQRAWCLERGIDTMTWTYDPLVARNAYFNIRRLGARADSYYLDFYGAMTDVINAGQRSDRMLIRWDLIPTPPAAATPCPWLGDAHIAVADLPDAPPSYVPPGADAHVALVAVPRDIEALRRSDPELARRWRTVTRAALGGLLDAGWAVTDFTRSCQYVLHRERTP
ncbi:putative GNAT superfamily acetyltransferase [Microcella alkaliphila]|uniref:Putative GNAT superfamily acetyltransferase n=1 Tax=Microcella alkaliphila TaxID=279828 RepID=A0A4Q7TZB6_9MICO|nr:GNAT family N-acetyltransferase [Microcella alkaliphila]RZT66455.1 putative GNAT superfamily acetyltransferase [Microcella alkaliphila]